MTTNPPTQPVTAEQLLERIAKCRSMVANMASEGRHLKMEIPAKHDENNEDIYICDTFRMMNDFISRHQAAPVEGSVKPPHTKWYYGHNRCFGENNLDHYYYVGAEHDESVIIPFDGSRQDSGDIALQTAELIAEAVNSYTTQSATIASLTEANARLHKALAEIAGDMSGMKGGDRAYRRKEIAVGALLNDRNPPTDKE